MIVYNITTKVHHSIDQAWLQWQREINIPATMATGCFNSFKMMRLLEHDDSEGYTYAVQYTSASEAAYQLYIDHHASLLREKALKNWGEKIISFHSLLEVIQ